ncbi:helix-turn-helix domain-containing protein [Dactylosporangium sp. NPDC049525]|uniref:helix-turn-helix domain-containing protein n=1 Tax=Dactylosporangium sp. NPDC049525 TaxID=3154730 RepID=UPI00343237B4
MPDSDAAPSPTIGRPVRWRTAQVRDEMVRRYLQHGQSLRQIAGALGCSYGTVHVVLTTAKVQFRPKGGGTRRKRRTS